ncbi:MAG: ribonuclease P protein component [Syntrophales bacterium]|nr:ribonuclease P protein component [Syntrophales bacterium]
MPDRRFRKCERLTKRKDIARVFAEGRRSGSGYFKWIIAPNGIGKTRFGIITSRRIGGAVKRNRIKRLLREVFRLNKHHFPAGHDIIVIVKKPLPPLSYAEVEKALSDLYFDEGHV